MRGHDEADLCGQISGLANHRYDDSVKETTEVSVTESAWNRRAKVGISFEKAVRVQIKLMGTPFEDDQTCGLRIQPILRAS